MEDEFLKEYEELFVWKAFYLKNRFYSSYPYLEDERNVRSIISDTYIYKTLYEKATEVIKSSNDPVLIFKIPYYVKTKKYNDLFEELINPGYLKTETIESIKKMTNKEKVEVVFIKAIIYLYIMSSQIYTLDDEITVSVILWMIYIINLFQSIIKKPKHLDYLNEYIDTKVWFKTVDMD